MTTQTIIGKYACEWHEGTLIITLKEYFKDTDDMMRWGLQFAPKYNEYYPVNYCWDVFAMFGANKHEIYGELKLDLHLNEIEELNLAIFCVLSSMYQDKVLPFDDWSEVFIPEIDTKRKFTF